MRAKLTYGCAVMAIALAGCAQALDPVVQTATFLDNANRLSSAPQEPGAFPSAFAVDERAPAATPQPTLSLEERRRIIAEMRAAGTASEAEIRRIEARLAAASPQ